jgi:phospholipase C
MGVLVGAKNLCATLVTAAIAFVLLAALSSFTPVAQAQPSPIQHVIVLYMENHSFDNVFGFWCDRHPDRCPHGGMPSKVTLADGTVVTPSVAPDTVPAATHGVEAQTAAVDGGKMDGWSQVFGCDVSRGYACISGYKPWQIPNIVKLAEQFAISDDTFSMNNSASWAGHLYAAMASIDGFSGDLPVPAPGVTPGPSWGCNSNKVTQWAPGVGAPSQWVPSCVPDPKLDPTQYPNGGAFEPTPVKYEPTIFDRLEAAGLSWRIYIGNQSGGSGGWAICPSLAECWDTSQRNNELSINQFVSDAAGGHLPNFSIINPGGPYHVDSEHNGDSMTAGDNWMGQIAHDVMTSPEWASTALFITYDDCGCFYDHVPPGVNPDLTVQGPRSPLVIVSPYARPGYTDARHTTFAGILAYVEHTFGLAPLSPNDANAYRFNKAFNYSQSPLQPAQMATRRLPASAKKIHRTAEDLKDPT